MVVVSYVDATTYPSGTSFAFEVLKSNVSGKLSFNSDPTYDIDNFPELPQPILVRVQAPPPYGIPLTLDWSIYDGMVGAVKVEVLEKPSPGKVYGSNISNVIFWNWPDQTPPAFSALMVRCSPQLLPDKVVRYPNALFQGYLRDTKEDMSSLGATSNYLSLIGTIHSIAVIVPSCQAYCSLDGYPLSNGYMGSDYIIVPDKTYPSDLQAVQHLDAEGFSFHADSADWIGEAAPDLGYWVAFLPFHEDFSRFKDVLLAQGCLLH